MKFSPRERQALGLSYILERLSPLTPYGRELKRELQPLGSLEAVQGELRRVDTVKTRLPHWGSAVDRLLEVLAEFKDIRGSLDRLDQGEVLTDLELFELKLCALLLQDLGVLLDILDWRDEELHPLPEVLRLLDPENTALRTFHLYDGYSGELAQIRKKKRMLEEEIRRCPEEEKIPLFQHRRQVVREEEEEEYEVRAMLSAKLAPHTARYGENLRALGRLDFLLAKGLLAREGKTVLPVMESSGMLELQDGLNPYVSALLAEQGKTFQPVTLTLLPGSTVVTGANMGGKSVTLRTLVLNATLAGWGILPYARHFRLPYFQAIFWVAEDLEDLERGLSSFGGEILRLKEILRSLGKRPSLVVLDEPARGTNPQEGASLVTGLLRYFQAREDLLLVTTHYEIPRWEGVKRLRVKGLQEAKLETFSTGNPQEERELIAQISSLMDYSLEEDEEDVPGRDALRIAKILGLPEEIFADIEINMKGNKG